LTDDSTLTGLQRQARLRRIMGEVQASRTRLMREMAGQNREVTDRLRGAYRDILPGLVERMDRFSTDESPAGTIGFLVSDIRRDLRALEGPTLDAAAAMERTGAEGGARAGLRNLSAGGVRVQFGAPQVEAIRAGINYVESPAFRQKLVGIADYHAEKIENLLITAIAQGRNPRETARLARQYLQGEAPLVDALRMTRTTQIYAARRGSQAVYQRGAVERWLWSANLGNPRTCMACIAMHGTVHSVDEVLNDHHNGRCAPVPITPTWRELGLDGGEEIQVETGVEWFLRQPAGEQQRIMKPELYDAYQRGLFQFRPERVVGVYGDDLFGPMRRRRTNEEILGNG
jgi:hypothetical protein